MKSWASIERAANAVRPFGTGSTALRAGARCVLISAFILGILTGCEDAGTAGGDETQVAPASTTLAKNAQPSAPPDKVLDAELAQVTERKQRLKKRLASELPSYERLIEEQARQVVTELEKSSSANITERLRIELEEIARCRLAASRHREEIIESEAELESTERGLVRLKTAKAYFGKDFEKLLEETRNVGIRVDSELGTILDTKLGVGAIAESDVDRMVESLIAETKTRGGVEQPLSNAPESERGPDPSPVAGESPAESAPLDDSIVLEFGPERASVRSVPVSSDSKGQLLELRQRAARARSGALRVEAGAKETLKKEFIRGGDEMMETSRERESEGDLRSALFYADLAEKHYRDVARRVQSYSNR